MKISSFLALPFPFSEYVKLYVNYILNKSMYKQFYAFYHGFHSVCASNALIVSTGGSSVFVVLLSSLSSWNINLYSFLFILFYLIIMTLRPSKTVDPTKGTEEDEYRIFLKNFSFVWQFSSHGVQLVTKLMLQLSIAPTNARYVRKSEC